VNTKVLEEIGLTPGEIKAYMALLELGSSSTGPIANASQVSRSKLYSILDKLEKKGLVSHVEQNGVIYFQAAEPSKIKDYIRKRKEELEGIAADFEQFLPQLTKLHEHAGKVQTVSVYQGLNGLKTAHEHLYLKLKKGETFCYIGVSAYQPEAQHRYWRMDHERRAREGLKCKILFNRDTSRKVMENRNSYNGSDARYMPTDIKTPAYFLIYKDTVMIAVPSENPVVVEITSQEIADAFMAYFNEFWKRTVPFK
jgi:sugar-specific transcriptional regulator TrmB